MQDQIFIRPVRVTSRVEKWEPGRGPDDGPPDAVAVAVAWHDTDGSEITDPDRIAALNAERDAERIE